MKTFWRKLFPICAFIVILTQTAFGFTNGEWIEVKNYEERQNYYVDRSEICKYAVHLYKQFSDKKIEPVKNTFQDAPSDEFPYIAQAHSMGIVSGIDKNTFLPGKIVTKGELAGILYQTIQKTHPEISLETTTPLVFKENIAPEMEPVYQFAVSRGFLSYNRNGIIGFQNKLTLKEALEILDSVKKASPAFPVVVTELPTVKNSKIAYLTFDDGVSKNTPVILDTLKQNNVKATFFITGEAAPELLLRMKDEGHSIGNHTYSHDYSQIYSSIDNFWADFNKEEDYLESVLGYRPLLMRFPGGSNNSVSQKYNTGNIMNILTSQAKEMGYTYFDWNVSAGDASKVKATKAEIISNVVNGSKGKKEVVVLMHQNAGKEATAAALSDIIQELKTDGYDIEALTDNSFCPQFLK